MPRKPKRHCQLTKPHPFTFSPFARSVARVANSYKVKSQIQNSKFHRKSSPNSSGDKLGYHSLADKSEPSESSDEEEFEGIVQADFAFFDPKPNDFHGVKVLLQTYLDDKQWDLSGFVDLILGQTTVGTIVKIEEDEDDTPYSVVTALNLRRYKHNNAGQKEAASNSSEEAMVYVSSVRGPLGSHCTVSGLYLMRLFL